MQIWPCHKKVKGHPRIIIWTNLVDLEFQMLYTKIQPQSCPGLEKMFKCFFVFFLRCIGMADILFNGGTIWEIVNILSIEGSMRNLVKTGQEVSEEKTFKDNMIS